MPAILPVSFYEKETVTVAKKLLGCRLVRQTGKKIIRARVTETEAYIGEDDLACHASRGRTKRTEVMYSEAGRAYVYLIYGMYHCLNIVTEAKGFPAAVLIRAVEIEGISLQETNGPGKLCRFLNITRTLNTCNITQGKKLWIERGVLQGSETILTTKRVGVDYAGHCKEYLWRFVLKED